ncbi:DUF2798 domain-containing protein [Halomonas getboli]|uniref:DUF2798 domain-containing protein n=1 Tax=Halomonas getboli TaxID=2935862 RepID=UPI001FFF6694|nr:DUF2798 domain-containing protein [Halomonas getboli]MCK2182432.1 DUF2798 domain-containing protein [Halomonas getboli]
MPSRPTQDAAGATRRRGVPIRFAPVVFAFYMSALMTLLMSLVITAVNAGVDAGYPAAVAQAYVRAVPVAFIGVLSVRPLVVRLVGWTLADDGAR